MPSSVPPSPPWKPSFAPPPSAIPCPRSSSAPSLTRSNPVSLDHALASLPPKNLAAGLAGSASIVLRTAISPPPVPTSAPVLLLLLHCLPLPPPLFHVPVHRIL